MPNSSHNTCYDNTRFAVDLATPAFRPSHLVLAPRAGTVSVARGGCTSQDLSFQDEEPAHQYALARALIDEGFSSVAEGERVLAGLESLSTPTWVRPWARMRRAMLHLDAGDATLARALLAEPMPAGVKDDREWPKFINTLAARVKQLGK